MTFTYSSSLTSNRDRVRLNLADTDSSAYAFEDEEIDALLSSEGSVVGATIACIQALVANKSRRMRIFSIPGITYNDTAQVAALKTLLDSYGGGLPVVSIANPTTHPFDDDYTSP